MTAQNTLNYFEQGGGVAVFGGTIDLSGTTKKDAQTLQDFLGVHKVALAAVDTAGGLFAWENPYGVAVLAELVLDVTTQSTGACTADCGPAADGVTLNDTLIDGLSVATAGVYSSLDTVDNGTNGKPVRKVGSTEFVTGSVASGASAGIVGSAYIRCWKA